MTLLASVASLFCTFSVSAAAPSVAVVPEGTVNRVEIISPSVQTSTALAAELQLSDDDAIVADAADEGPNATADKVVADGSADKFVAAGKVSDEDSLPADVIVDAEALLPADVIVDAVDLLPADVVADVDDSGIEAVSEANAEGTALAEAAADAGTFVDEQPEEDLAPTAPPSEEPGAKSDAGESSGDSEAAS